MDERLPTASEAVSAFLRDAELEGMAPRSIGVYRSYLSVLASDQAPVLELQRTLRGHLHTRCAALHPNSVAVVMAAHRSFVRYCLSQGWLLTDPLAGLKSPKHVEPPHRFLTPADVRRLQAAAIDRRDRALLALLCLGLRVGEACAAKWSDIRDDDEGPYLYVVSEKRGTPRSLPLSDADLAALWSMPQKRETILCFNTHNAWVRIKALGQKAGVSVHPHALRHAFAMRYLEASDGDQGTLQTLMGHRSATMTRFYSRSALERTALKRARGLRLF